MGFRNYLQWSYPKQYIRVNHVELTITSNKKSLCKQCLFLKSNLKQLVDTSALPEIPTDNPPPPPGTQQEATVLLFIFFLSACPHFIPGISSRSCTVVLLHYCSYSSAPELKLSFRYFLFPDSLEHYWY